jgi:hypothetical protein
MFGVLIAILGLNYVAPRSSILRERDVPLIVSPVVAVIAAGSIRPLAVLVV